MGQVKLFWSGQRVMERWGIYSTELAAYIYNGLPALTMKDGKFLEVPPEEVKHFDADSMTDFVFDPDDVKDFEKEHGITPAEDPESEGSQLSPQDARELGLLRAQREKMDSTIHAAVNVGMFCAKSGHPIIRKEIVDLVIEFDRNIPDVSTDKMWEAIPQKLKKGPGRPRSEPELSTTF